MPKTRCLAPARDKLLTLTKCRIFSVVMSTSKLQRRDLRQAAKSGQRLAVMPADLINPASVPVKPCTPEQFAAFLPRYAAGLTVAAACAAAGTTWTAIALYRTSGSMSPAESAQLEQARKIRFDTHEDLAADQSVRLGVEGYDVPLSWRGKLTGHKIRTHSEASLDRLMRRGQKVELSGPNGGAIAIGALVVGPVPPVSLAEWADEYQRQRAAAGRGPFAAGAKPVAVAVDGTPVPPQYAKPHDALPSASQQRSNP